MTNINKIEAGNFAKYFGSVGQKRYLPMIGVLLLTAGIFGQQATPETSPTPAVASVLTLEQAIDAALSGNRTLQSSLLDVSKAREQSNAFRTRFYPAISVTALGSQPLRKFDVTIRRGQLGNLPDVGPVPAEDRSFGSSLKPNLLLITQISQPITKLYSLRLDFRSKKIGEQIASEAVRLSRQQIVADVKKAYFSIMQNQSNQQSVTEEVEFYTELQRVTRERVNYGVALKAELFEIDTSLERTKLNLFVIENQMAGNKEQLNQLIGREIGREINTVPIPQMVDYFMRTTGLTEAQAAATNQRPELRQAKLRLEQAKLDTRSKRFERYPEVSGTVSEFSPLNYSSFLPKYIINAGVTVQYNFDWGRNRHEVKEKKLAEQQADLKIQELESSVMREVNASFRKMQENGRAVMVADLNRKTAKAKLAVTLNRYQEGEILLKDVLQMQASVADTDFQYQKAMLDFWTAKAEFEKAIGEEN